MDTNLIKKSGIFVALAVVFILALSAASAQVLPLEVPLHVSYETPFNYYGDAAQYYFPSFSKEMCETGQDFIIEIPPGACSPAVVRSDLLEEQDVPVFCKLSGIKINPLIEVPNIKRIMLTQKEAHKDIRTVLFHPARIGLQSSFVSLIGSPTLNDWGYLVVVLNRKATEKEMPDMIEANLSAKIEYEIEKTFGIAENQILLEILTDDEWKNNYEKYGFWNGKGYVKAKDIEKGKAKIEVYDGSLRHLGTFNLEEGETSNPSYMPGFYCAAGYKVKLEDIEYPQIRAELYVNDDKLIVTKGMTLQDSSCVVEKIQVADYGLGGSVRIRCPEGYYTLTKKATSKANLNLSITKENKKESKVVNVGDIIYGNLRLVYAGKVMKDERILNVVVVANATEKISSVVKEFFQNTKKYFFDREGYQKDKQKIFEKEGEVAKKLKESLSGYLDRAYKESWLGKTLGLKAEKWVIVNSDEIGGITIEIGGIEGLQSIRYDDTLEGYYKKAKDAYHDVAEDYPDLVDKSGDEYGAKALQKAAEKAGKLGKTFDQAVLLEELIREYPDSGIATEARERLADLYSTADIEKASKFISSEGRDYSVELIDIIEPTREEINVELSIDDSAPKVFTEHDLLAKDEWQISEIKEDVVHFTSLNTSAIVKINEGEEDFLGKTKVKVAEITLKKFARVSVLPWSKEGVTYANFTFRVGIEKRAIKLSPEQTKDYIEKLDKTISKWENINKKLGNLVTTWKRTCLIGGIVLTAKNVLESFSGKGMARRMVMSGDKELGIGGWKSKCEKLMAEDEEKYSSMSDCYLQHNDAIESEVELMLNAIKTTNENSKKAEEGNMREGKPLFLGFYTPKSLDKEGYIKKYGGIIGEQYTEAAEVTAKLPALYEERYIYPSDVRSLATLLELKKQCKGKTGGICENINSVVEKKLSYYNNISTKGGAEKSMLDAFKESGISISGIKTVGAKGKKLQLELFKLNSETLASIDKGGIVERPADIEELTAAFFTAEFTRKTYLAVLDHMGGTDYNVKDLYEIEEIKIEEGKNKINVVRKLDQDEVSTILERIEVSYIEGIEPNACVNPYKSKEIRFWESGPYKGLPALMPIDTKRGWYAATKAYGSGLEAYQESASISNFWICNVGRNGEPDFDFSLGPEGDDAVCCAQIPFAETYAGQIYSLDGTQSGVLVEQARKCMKEAARDYKDGKKRIATSCCPDCVMGKPAVSAPSTTCENFMSPADCNLMFNLCDPVVCPNSRCNFGGRMPVDDVIQTGVIGGLTLCLPNAKEVAVPVCLSGIHAGLENYMTILKSTKACLEESLKTGKNIGICDQLKSVYICEFFWRQLTPFLKVGVPSLVEGLLGGRKSGGEYLAFSDAWKNAGDSVKYFMDYYDDEAFKAFTTRSMAEAGTQVCKSFVSLQYPDQVDLWDELTKPESPYQLNAIFYETPMTTATVPAMSHYKVYYHIYAGEEKGHYYMIYLKQPPKSGYYQTPELYPVPEAVGYIPVGQFVDVAKDFTAPANYIELCVRIDAKDHCGFGKATTTFAVDELMDSYVSKQAATEITTEKECISGTPGMIAPNLNPQALVEETIEPALWRRGIVRICSSGNPGVGVEPERWMPIGYCESKDVKCWLDKESVEGAIKDIGLEKKTIEEAENISKKLLEGGFISREDAEGKLSVIEKETPIVLAELKGLTEKKEIDVKIADIITRLSNLVKNSLAEDIRARAQIQIGAIYNHIAILLKPKEVAKAEAKGIEEKIALPKIVLSDVLFDFDSDVLKAESKSKLLEELKTINPDLIDKIRVYGYASDEGIEEQESYNKDLSQRRANAVKKVIEENFPKLNVIAISKGITSKYSKEPYTTEQLKEKKTALGEEAFKDWAAKDEQLALNRRVNFEVTTKAKAEIKEEVEKEEEITEKIEMATEETGIKEPLAYIQAGESFLKEKKWQQAYDSFGEAENRLTKVLDDDTQPFYARINAKTQLERIADFLKGDKGAERIFYREQNLTIAKEFYGKYLEMANKVKDFIAKREFIFELKQPYWLNREQRDTSREPKYSTVWPIVEGGSAYKGVKFKFTIKKDVSGIGGIFTKDPELDSYEVIFDEKIGMAVGKAFTPKESNGYYFTVSIIPDYEPLRDTLSKSKLLKVSEWGEMKEETRKEIKQNWLSEYDDFVKTAEKNWNILSDSEKALCTRVDAKEKFEKVIKQLKQSAPLIYSELGLIRVLAGEVDKESEKLYFELKEKFYDKADELEKGLETGYLSTAIVAPEEAGKIAEAVLSLKIEKPYWVSAKDTDKKLDLYNIADPETPHAISARMVLEGGYAYEGAKFTFKIYKISPSILKKSSTTIQGPYTFRKGRVLSEGVSLAEDYSYRFDVESVDCPAQESLKLKSLAVNVIPTPGI